MGDGNVHYRCLPDTYRKTFQPAGCKRIPLSEPIPGSFPENDRNSFSEGERSSTENQDLPLATNVDSFSLFLTPGELVELTPQEVINRVNESISYPLDNLADIYEKIPLNWHSVYSPIEILSGLDLYEITPIAENKDYYPGITWESRPNRYYNTEGKHVPYTGLCGKDQ